MIRKRGWKTNAAGGLWSPLLPVLEYKSRVYVRSVTKTNNWERCEIICLYIKVRHDGGKKTCLEIQDDAPNKMKNNRRDAVSNTRGINAKQFHLRDKRKEFIPVRFILISK